MSAESRRELRIEHVHGRGGRIVVHELQILMRGMENLHYGRIGKHRRKRRRIGAELAVERAAYTVRSGHLGDGKMGAIRGAPDELRIESGHSARD